MKKWTPFLVASVLVSIATIFILKQNAAINNGTFCYPLDDTFIHMAVAKNIVLHQTWGVNPGEWVSSSSSPLFTLLLSLSFALLGISIYIPLALAWFGALLLLWAIQREMNLREIGYSFWQKLLVLLLISLATALPLMIILGMEHTLQTACTILFVSAAASLWQAPARRWSWSFVIWGAAMLFFRYENIFVVVPVCALLLFRTKPTWTVFAMGLLIVSPVLLFGLYFLSKGGYPIPNSVLVKGNTKINMVMGGQYALPVLTGSVGGLLVVGIVVALQKLQSKTLDRVFFFLVVFVLATLGHGVFAQLGWYYRYECYLIALGTLPLLLSLSTVSIKEKITEPYFWVAGLLFLSLTGNLVLRTFNGTKKTPAIVHNIYGQQMQMGKFIQTYYPKGKIAANDIGALCFYGDIYMLDLWGLANNDITAARRKGYWSNAFMQKMVADKKIDVIIIYDSWFDRNISRNWIKVAQWVIPNNIIGGDDDITFYTTNPEAAKQLKLHLQAFESQQPKDNTWEYFLP